ncbi:MAG: alanine--tRNA ligase [bacterium]
MNSQEIRERYRNFFVKRAHEAWPSDSLVPRNDPTLLFTSAGMVQFKPYFRGEMGDTLKRATTCQKCFRTSDIENVGFTHRHHTFFEMLGNFSFGDYFKRDAIRWSWEFSLEELKLDPDRIWVSIFENDDEAADLWEKEVGYPRDRIVRLGVEDNWWPGPGIPGPSGPCSELYYDMGPEYGPETGPRDDNERYLEYWNLVFTQFDTQLDGSQKPLARKNIDTGAGLDRIAAIVQNKFSNFENDILSSAIAHIEERSGEKFNTDLKKDIAFRVISDHARATVFVLTDNVTPSNTGRGYVLRRIMRRAIRYGLVLGIEKSLLTPAMKVVAETMRNEYPELLENLDFTTKVAEAEEQTFRSTLERGLLMLDETIRNMKQSGRTVLDGREAFKLYDTFGFPADLTAEILRESGLSYDEPAFEEAMEEQRRRAQAAWKGSGEVKTEVDADLPATEFTGYESPREETRILALFRAGKSIESGTEGDLVEVVLEKTPFYAEAGGQLGDEGTITQGAALEIKIETVRKTANNIYLHYGRVQKGTAAAGETVTASVNPDTRNPTMSHHTATHLLQAALREVLGTHIKQSGSAVGPDSLRFDFTHYAAVDPEELSKIEARINHWVWENRPVRWSVVPIKEAEARGATALFGEKYGSEVRMLEIEGDEKPVSLELCGGTHVRSTGAIGPVRIVAESAISAGNRRIEAVAGPAAVQYTLKREKLLQNASHILKVGPEEVPSRVEKILDQNRSLEKEIHEIREKLLRGETVNLLEGVEEINGITVLARAIQAEGKNELQAAMDQVMPKIKTGVVVFAATDDDKVTMVFGVTPDLTQRLPALTLAKELAKIVGGGGGGRKDRAQAGGKDPSKLPEVFEAVRKRVEGLEN